MLRQIALGAPRREAFDALRERNTSVGIGHLRDGASSRPRSSACRSPRRSSTSRATCARSAFQRAPPARAEGDAARVDRDDRGHRPRRGHHHRLEPLRQHRHQPVEVSDAGERTLRQTRACGHSSGCVLLVPADRAERHGLRAARQPQPGARRDGRARARGLRLVPAAALLGPVGRSAQHAPRVPGRRPGAHLHDLSPTSARRARSSSTRSAPRCWPGCSSGRPGAACSAAGCWSATTRWSSSAATGCTSCTPTRRATSRRSSCCRRCTRWPPPAAPRCARCSTARPRRSSALASAERRGRGRAERARVAREMHDSLGKTLYGIALAARGLSHRIERRGAGRRGGRARPVGRRAGGRRGGAGADLRPALGHARAARWATRWSATSRALVASATGSPPSCRPTASTCRTRARATSCSAS